MDIYQMGGGDSLYDKIDRGMRGCKAVVSCVTQKYSLSANCRREVSLADALKKPIIPLLLEDIKWPPDGPMSMVFTQLLYINFHRDEALQMTWEGDKYEELRMKLGEFIPETGTSSLSDKTTTSPISGNSSAATVGGKGAPDDKSKSTVTSENSKPNTKVGEDTKEDGNISTSTTQQNNNTDVKQSQDNSKQVNGGSNEPKSKSCVIL